MRATIFIAAAGLALSACGDNSATEGNADATANLASEAIFSNDTTVIDAATGDAVNMAADVVYTEDDANLDGNAAAPGRTSRRSATRRSAESAATSNADEDAAPMETVSDANSL